MRKIIMLLSITTFIITNTFIYADTKYNLEDDFGEAGFIIGQFEGYSDGFIYSIGNKPDEEELSLYLEILGTLLEPNYKTYFPNHSLNTEEKEDFEARFVEGFKSGFMDGYNGITLQITYELESFESLGVSYGEAYGNSMAVRDYEIRRGKNAERAYNEFNAAENVFRMLDMHIIEEEDRESMLRVIEDSFISAYDTYYDNLYINEISQEGNYLNLFLTAVSFSYDEFKSEVVGKGTAITTMPALSIEIEEFTFYEEAFLRISKNIREQFLPIDNKRLMTDSYDLTIFNKVTPSTPTSANATKPFEISFNGVGSDRAGIYKMVNGEWTYQYTKFEDINLVHTVPTGDFSGGIYAVLIDYDYPIVTGINLSWAYEALYTYLRREYLFLDNETSYDPAKEITRKEFAYLIYKNSYDADYNSYENKTFKDKSEFGTYEAAINYCYNKGYLYGINEEEFNPNGTLTYEQVEIVMQRLLKKDFTFNEISNSMMNDKFKKSNYLLGNNQNINRDEAVYTFYYLFR